MNNDFDAVWRFVAVNLFKDFEFTRSPYKLAVSFSPIDEEYYKSIKPNSAVLLEKTKMRLEVNKALNKLNANINNPQ